MSLVSSAVLNAASASIVFLLAMNGAVRSDYRRAFLTLYGVLCVVLLLAGPAGGQVNAALALGLAVHAALSAASSETQRRTTDFIESKQSTYVVSGIINAHSGADRAFSTYDKASASYRHLPRSVNRFGGAQFSVSLWLFVKGSISDDQVAGRTLFMRGDKTKYSPMFSPDGEHSKQAYFPAKENASDYAIVAPRIHFPTGKNASNKLIVDVNTDRQLIQRFEIGSDEMNLDLRKNALSLIPNSWVLFTFTFQDAYDLSSFEKGIRMRFFVNDTLYSEQTAPGALRLNTGPAHILPGDSKETAGIPGAFLSDIAWHNWSLEPAEVSRLYAMGFNSNRAEDEVNTGRTLQLSARNKVDVSNMDAHIARNRPF